MELEGQVAIVTGAGKGIGRAVALELADGRRPRAVRETPAGLPVDTLGQQRIARRLERLEVPAKRADVLRGTSLGRPAASSWRVTPRRLSRRRRTCHWRANWSFRGILTCLRARGGRPDRVPESV
jgi:NAD(P)-dependent dehydrogenase (short-subunit alcohol dehydrogenase family)